ncbi:MAG: hypothetical protein AAFU78_08190 [Cyanobacteria bacterium J06633_2]
MVDSITLGLSDDVLHYSVLHDGTVDRQRDEALYPFAQLSG